MSMNWSSIFHNIKNSHPHRFIVVDSPKSVDQNADWFMQRAWACITSSDARSCCRLNSLFLEVGILPRLSCSRARGFSNDDSLTVVRLGKNHLQCWEKRLHLLLFRSCNLDFIEILAPGQDREKRETVNTWSYESLFCQLIFLESVLSTFLLLPSLTWKCE